MSETVKTLMYFAVAVVAVALAWEPWRPSNKEEVVKEEGQKLFPNFDDAQKATDLEVTQYDEATSTPRQFKISRVNGVWSIPSHDNYPADAKAHMATIATSIKNLDILGLKSSSPGDYELYGVVDPDPNTLQSGATGVGMKVVIKDAKDAPLADLIIGKAVKDNPALRYVRRANSDRIYEVKFSPETITAKFEDWIEKDLLKLDANNINKLQLNDYTMDLRIARNGQPTAYLDNRGKMILGHDATAKEPWRLIESFEFKERKEVPAPLKPDQELNVQNLNSLTGALSDLKIVDVHRKPKGLSANLRVTEDFVQDKEAMLSLMKRGFYYLPSDKQDGGGEMYASQGETICLMKDGVEYMLRFGSLEGKEEGAVSKEEPGADGDKEPKNGEAKDGKDAKKDHLTRNLFVMVRFNPDAIEKPKLEPLPEDKNADKKPGKPAEENAAKPADENSAKPANNNTEKKADDPAAKNDGEKPAETTADTRTDEEKEYDAKRAVIEQDNQRKQAAYDAQIKMGQKHVADLNERFADWFYVISDDVYKKIHLGRDELVKTKEKPPGEGDGVTDLNALEKALKGGVPGAPKGPRPAPPRGIAAPPAKGAAPAK